MSTNILITGCSSGLGLALTKYYLNKGFNVLGISRKRPNIDDKNLKFISLDLSKIKDIKKILQKDILHIQNFEHVFLNAGTLGSIKVLENLAICEIKNVMDLNVYANKEILDILKHCNAKNIIAISSGASVNGSIGWGAYSLSKASLNMLINLYSKEISQSKLISLAPGVIETPMTDHIRYEVDDNIFTSAKVLKNGEIQKPFEAVEKIDNFLKDTHKYQSGSFIDIRNI